MTGSAVLDFGASPGVQEASANVTGQSAILLSSLAEAFFMADSTSQHTASDHQYAAHFIGLTCGNVVAGTGFTIYGRAQDQMTGQFQVRWVWN